MVRFGILGAGRIGRVHAGTIANSGRAGVAYVANPLIARLRALQAWFVQMFRLAQEPPRHTSTAADEKHV